MKKPYLSNYMQDIKINNPSTYYDSFSQITYVDDRKKTKIIEKLKCGSTLETKSIEDSDPDELFVLGSTKQTFTVEQGDPDEFVKLDQSIITETVENSDPDEFFFF